MKLSAPNHFEICSKLKDLQQPEEEIWLTSFWNLEVNRIERVAA